VVICEFFNNLYFDFSVAVLVQLAQPADQQVFNS